MDSHEMKELNRSTLASDGFLMVNKKIARHTSLDAAALLGALISYEKYFDNRDQLDNGWFFNTQDKIEWDTTLTPYKQREAYKTLKSKGLIEVQKRGLPSKNYYRINHQAIYQVLATQDQEISPYKDKTSKDSTTSGQNFSPQVVKKMDTNKILEQDTNNNSSRTTKVKDLDSVRGAFLDRFLESYSLYRHTRYRPIPADLGALKSIPVDDLKSFLALDEYYRNNGKPDLFQRWLDPNTLGYRDEWAASNTDLGIAILLKPDIYRRYMDQFKAVLGKITDV